MRDLTEKEKQAFLLINRLSHYGEESVGILGDLLKDLVLNDEIGYTENRIISKYSHKLNEYDKENDYYFDKNSYQDYRAFREWEIENENGNKLRRVQ